MIAQKVSIFPGHLRRKQRILEETGKNWSNVKFSKYFTLHVTSIGLFIADGVFALSCILHSQAS